MQLIPFHPLKATQAAGVLLKTEPGRQMTRLRLLKLLYIADRNALKERARPITGDSVVAMDHGPVLSQTYDLLKGADFSSTIWDRFMQSESYWVKLIADPGVGKLSRYEITTLQAAAKQFSDENDWAIVEHTHTFEEWRKNQPAAGTSKRIPLDDLLAATNRLDAKDELTKNAHHEALASRLFGEAEG